MGKFSRNMKKAIARKNKKSKKFHTREPTYQHKYQNLSKSVIVLEKNYQMFKLSKKNLHSKRISKQPGLRKQK